MGKLGKRKEELLSESCTFKNLLKYASHASWDLGGNKHLLACLTTTFVTNSTLQKKGWISLLFGDTLLADDDATSEILLLLSALLVNVCKHDKVIHDQVIFSWENTGFLLESCDTSEVAKTLSLYLVPKDKHDLQLTELAIEDLLTGLKEPASMAGLIRACSKRGTLRRRWFQNSKKHFLKPNEAKALRLLACLLLGAPESLNSGEGVSRLLKHAFDVKHTTLKKHIGDYWKTNTWLEMDLKGKSFILNGSAKATRTTAGTAP